MNNLLFDNDEHKERETMETEKKRLRAETMVVL